MIRLICRFSGLFICLCLPMLLNGCLKLQKEYPEIRVHSIEASREGISNQVLDGASLKVSPLQVSDGFEDIFFTYRVSHTSYESDFYNQFLTSPDEMFLKELKEWFARRRLFEYVVDWTSGVSTTHELHGELLSLYADYRDEENPAAVLSMKLLVSEREGGKRVILHQELYEKRIPFSTPSAEKLLHAWNAAFTEILTELENDLSSKLALQS